MHYISLIGTVALVNLLAVISPGPDFVMCVRNSLIYSRRTGIFTAVGFGGGILVHILYCALGLGLLISRSILLFNFIKLLGAAYLIFIGGKSLLAKSSPINVGELKKETDISPRVALKIGFLTNVLNPKATLFYLSLFTLVIGPNVPASILVILSAVMVIEIILWFSIVSIFLTQAKIRSAFGKFQGIFNKILGGILIALGVKVALSSRE